MKANALFNNLLGETQTMKKVTKTYVK